MGSQQWLASVVWLSPLDRAIGGACTLAWLSKRLDLRSLCLNVCHVIATYASREQRCRHVCALLACNCFGLQSEALTCLQRSVVVLPICPFPLFSGSIVNQHA